MKNPFIQKDSHTQIYSKLAMIAKYGTDDEKSTLIKLWKNGDDDVSDSIIKSLIFYGNDKHREKIYKALQEEDRYASSEIKDALVACGPDSIREKILDKIAKIKMDSDGDGDDYDDSDYNIYNAVDAILSISPDKISKYLFSKNKLLAAMVQKIIEKHPIDNKKEE